MGRSSTSGMVYLVKRPEGGFSYVRNLSNGLAETLSGELDLSWSAGRRKVGGGKILKIALATSDLNLARQRWLEVHPQVEHLIGFAKDTFQRKRKRPSVVRRLRVLPHEAIRQIADDVYQRILASDDEEALSGEVLTRPARASAGRRRHGRPRTRPAVRSRRRPGSRGGSGCGSGSRTARWRGQAVRPGG